MAQNSLCRTSNLPPHYFMIHEIYVLFDDGDRHVLGALNLTRPQYSLLTMLDPHDKEIGQRLTTLSERLLYSKSQITRLVDQLEHAKLVERLADPDDRRAQRVILTTLGVDRRTQACAAHHASLTQRLSILNGEEQQQLRLLLDKLRAGLHADLAR
jgi:DNA-binding MarR family transcriptional regulator